MITVGTSMAGDGLIGGFCQGTSCKKQKGKVWLFQASGHYSSTGQYHQQRGCSMVGTYVYGWA
jgi:hypothetical protein